MKNQFAAYDIHVAITSDGQRAVLVMLTADGPVTAFVEHSAIERLREHLAQQPLPTFQPSQSQ